MSDPEPTQIPVLLVDDDERLAEMLVGYLARHGFALSHVANGEVGLRLATTGKFEVVLLDVMLPGMDGMEVCRRLRACSSVPIIMLTARGEETDRIVGLEIGADDYVPKPFSSRELVARMRAVLRRASTTSDAGNTAVPLHFGDLTVDPATRTVTRGGKPCDLTAYQFDLLYFLASRAGRVLTRDQIMEGVRGTELEAYDRSIDVHVSRIRAAIEANPRRPRYLVTVRGVGYQFCAPTVENLS